MCQRGANTWVRGYSLGMNQTPASKKIIKTLLVALLAPIAINLSLPSAYAAQGDLDSSFGSSGMVSRALGSFPGSAGNSVLAYSDGKYLVGGAIDAGATSDFALVRFNSNGSLDSTFSTDGIETTTVSVGDSSNIISMAFTNEGKIVVGGYVNKAGVTSIAIARYTSDGILDTTFSGDGIETTTIGIDGTQVRAIGVDSLGRIYAAGWANDVSIYQAFVARYNSAGGLDTTFSIDGIATGSIGDGLDESFNALIVSSDNKVIVGGNASSGGNYQTALMRFTETGTPDSTFGSANSGVETSTAFGSNVLITALSLDRNGKIVVGAQPLPASFLAVARYNANGTLDSSFSTDGIETTTSIAASAFIVDIEVDALNRIVIAGSAGPLSTNSAFMVGRYLTSGGLDTSFGTNGFSTTALSMGGSSGDQAYGLAINSNGQILVAGTDFDETSYSMALARYIGTSTPAFAEVGPDSGTNVATSPSGFAGIVFSRDKSHAVSGEINGPIWISSDSGQTWETTASPSAGWWGGVNISNDGQKISGLSGVAYPSIYFSLDGGVTWGTHTTTTPLDGWSFAGSNNGNKFIASVEGGDIYFSNDGGVTLETNSTTALLSLTYPLVASSGDGSKYAIAEGNHVYLSEDSGVTWSADKAPAISVGRGTNAIYMSEDGMTIILGESGIPGNGPLWITRDFGNSWEATDAQNPLSSGYQFWCGLSASSDATRIIAGDCTGGGYLYYSADSGATYLPIGGSDIHYGADFGPEANSFVVTKDATKELVRYVIVNPLSVITGTHSGGTTVTITGTDFITDGLLVKFGGVNANIVSSTSTSITLTTPAHAAGLVDVQIINIDGGSALLTGGFTYTGSPNVYIPEPIQKSTINSISPTTAVSGSSTSVVISGIFVEQISAIQVNGNSLTSGSWTQTSSSISFTLPSGDPGVYSIQLFNGSAPVLAPQIITLTAPVVIPSAPAATPTPKPTPTVEPTPTKTVPKAQPVKAKKKTIVCVKGKKSKKVKAVKPSCPKGYKKKK